MQNKEDNNTVALRMHLKMQRALCYYLSLLSATIRPHALCGTRWPNIGLEEVWRVFIHRLLELLIQLLQGLAQASLSSSKGHRAFSAFGNKTSWETRRFDGAFSAGHLGSSSTEHVTDGSEVYISAGAASIPLRSDSRGDVWPVKASAWGEGWHKFGLGGTSRRSSGGFGISEWRFT